VWPPHVYEYNIIYNRLEKLYVFRIILVLYSIMWFAQHVSRCNERVRQEVIFICTIKTILHNTGIIPINGKNVIGNLNIKLTTLVQIP